MSLFVILAGVVLTLVIGGLLYLAWSAPEGWEDETGFHTVKRER